MCAGGGTTSGFLSGGMLAGLRGAFLDNQDTMMEEGMTHKDDNLKIFSSNDESH